MQIWLHNQFNALLARQLAWQMRRAAVPAVDLARARRLLVIELGGLGDAVAALPAMAALQCQFPTADWTVICRDYVAELFELAWPQARVVGISKSRAGVARAVAAVGPIEWDVVVATCWSSWATLLALRVKARALTGFWQPWRVDSFGFEPRMKPKVKAGDHLELLRFQAVAPLGIAIPTELPAPRIVTRVVAWGAALQKHPGLKDKFGVFIPFSNSQGRTLNLTEARAALGVLAGQGGPVWLVGGPRQREGLQLLAKEPRQVAVDFSVGELAAVLEQAQWVVSINTGAWHMAVAVGTPSVGIYKRSESCLSTPIGLTQAIQVTDLQKLRNAINW